jgi:Ig-like domain from next to BRCA1 gene
MLKIRKPGAYIPAVRRYDFRARTPSITSVSGLQKPQEDGAQQAEDDHSRICVGTNIGPLLHGQSAPVDPDTVPTPISSNKPLHDVSSKPAELVDVSLPDFEPTTYGESVQQPVSFAFDAPVLAHESVDPSQSRYYSPTAAPLLPVPSPPPALPTEFICAVPSLHQNGQYTQEFTPSLHETSTRFAPWWGQSAWVPPTPPAPLPVPLRTPSTPRRSRSPEPLVIFEEQGDAANGSADTLVASAVPPSESDGAHTHTSLPHVPPMDFNELFDLASQFRHLLELPPVVTPLALPTQPKEMPDGNEIEPIAAEESVPTELASTQVDDAGTPLSLVALLSKPEKSPRPGVLDGISPGRLLSQLLDSSTTSLSTSANKPTTLSEDTPLRASFIADNNIPDGQIFPPGAEFVKSWRMRNDGPGPWPADAELVFVAGDKLMIDNSERFKVGSVPPGEEVDVWTGEMKAPDVPGKYISYWRLCDSKGRRFGHSIWIE